MPFAEVFLISLFLALSAVFHGTSGQTVVTLVGGTATFTDVPIPGTGGTTLTTAQGREIMRLDIFGTTISPSFQNRVTITNFNNGFRDGRVSFIIRNVQREDNGKFLCTSQFEGNQPCGSATLVVAGTPTKPSLNVLTDPVMVGNDVIVECQSSSTSVPASSALKLAYNLKENGRLALPQPTTASRFKISSISKGKIGARYSCIAYEQNTVTNQLTGLSSEDSDAYTMNPLYPPEAPVLTPPATGYDVSSGDVVPDITCKSACNPACSIDWYKDSQIFQSGATLVLGEVDKTDAGNYFCRARNSLDTKDAPLIITVEDKVSTPELVPPTKDYTVREGMTIDDIVCRAQCTPDCTYSWFKDGGQKISDTDRLALGTVLPVSSGTYTCRASNGEDSSEVSFTVDVQYPPKKPAGRELLTPNTRAYTVEEGALVLPETTCAADCNPSCDVQWTEAGGQPIAPGSTLSLGMASRDDTGVYTCTVTNALGRLTDSVEVNIQFSPEQISFNPPASQYRSVEGVDVIPDVQCAAICNPDCQYFWSDKDSSDLVSRSAVLPLGTADRFFAGTFTCIAINELGQTGKDLSIDVLYGPDQATLDPLQDTYTVPSGTPLPAVTCSADCNPDCEFKWVKDDSMVAITTLKTLTLGLADRRTAGIYKCVATNDYGSANVKFDLNVQFGPNSSISLQPPQNVHDLSEGDDLSVTCAATCDPVCSFRWEDDSGSVVSGDETLSLVDVTKEAAGKYTCVADNGLGIPAKRSVLLNVLIGPSGKITITPPGPTIPLKEDNSIVLTCTADCAPLCSFKWLKDSQELTSSNGILTLNDVKRNQDGAYTCEVTNSVGSDAKGVSLEVQYGPGNSITFTPDETTHPVEENSDLSVTCAADCKPDCTFVWQRRLANVAVGPVLLLDKVQRSQADVYSCTANNDVSEPVTKQVTVDVLYGPDEVRMFPDDPQLYPVQGSSVSLKCWAECNPACEYVWFKGSALLPDAADGELDLRNVTTASSGNYVCRASNNVGDPATRSVEINVRAGPGTTIRFNPPDDTAVVTEGNQFKVECIAECSPPCDYEWRKGAMLITGQSTLEFAATDREKAGSYICFASNDANSQASKPLTLDVQYGPGDSIALFPPWKNQSFMEGSPFNIKCSAECEPPCTYKWFLGPALLAYKDGVLFSDSARVDQAGTYTCQASNGIGSSSSTSVAIDIQTGPGSTISFTPPGTRQVVKEGEDLLVTCSADCLPSCSYTWNFEGQEVPSTDGRLQVSRINRDQKGTYSCVADNGFGNQGTKSLVVEVQYGPKGSVEIFPNASTQILNEGASLSLKCSADCSPDCDYTWYLGNDVIGSSLGVLSLVAVGPENAGTYRCTAENGIGLDSSDDITVMVNTGPGNTVKIEPEGPFYNVTEGQQLRLKCSAVCSPTCTYTWFFGFERVKRDDGVLVIDGVHRNASGPFVCYAANDVGLQGSKMIRVDVLYGPADGIALDPANDITVVMDRPFTLRCSASCHPPCSYTWFLGPLSKPSAGGKLNVRKATAADGGSYTCRADNDVGSLMSDRIVVDVQYGPRDTIRLEPEDPTYVVTEGDDVMVTCSADCKPDCQYSWFAGTEPVVSEDGKLMIPKFSRSMPRFFSCFAENGLGNRAMAALEIEVQYGPDGKASLFPNTSPITTTVGGSVSVQCTSECSPECIYTWTRNGEVVYTRLPGILELKAVMPEQAGTYICSAENGLSPPATASVDVKVLSGPGATIRFVPPGLTAQVQERGTLRVACTADCVPVCNFTWTRDEELVSSSSLLLLTNTERKDTGVYQCNALNDLGVNVTQQLSLTVEYGPSGSTKLFPPEETRNLNRGDTLIVQCSALCSPPCAYKWRKGAQQLSTEEGVLLVPNVTPDDSGRYTCTADNQRGPSESVSLALNVNFGPEDTVTFEPPGNSQSLMEGDSLRVHCMADCLPSCVYTWYLASRRLDTSDGLLVIDDITRDDAGTYTCHADNGVGRRMSQELLVDVQFPPNTPTFEPPTTSYTIRERIDSVADIRCFSQCNPRCGLQWLKDGIPLSTVGNVLSLTTPDRSADGVYSCVVSNEHGSRQKDLTIRVNYAPSITIFTINDRKTTYTVPEKYPVTLNCRVSSQPPSTITLFNGTKVIKEQEDTLQAKHSWKQAECLDAGTYSCEADNGVGAQVSVTTELRVLCAPRLDPRVFTQPYVAAKLGETAVIRVDVLAHPPPSFLWYKVREGVSSVILAGNNNSVDHSDKFFTVNGTTSSLTIENVQLADFGDYVVRMVNTRGTSNYTISLVPQSAPYPARNLTARPISARTVEVTWSPGFNGGSKQQFLLEYRTPGTNGWLILELDDGINDVTRFVSQNVTDLYPATSYTFRMRSRNLHGFSNYSNMVLVTTGDSKEKGVVTGEVNPTPVLMGVGLALGFLVGAGITAIVVVSKCRPKPRKHGENTIDDFRSDTTYDTLYLRDALWAQRHIKMRQNGGSISGLDGYDYKQPEDTVRGFNDYTSSLKPVGEMRTSL